MAGVVTILFATNLILLLIWWELREIKQTLIHKSEGTKSNDALSS